MKNIWLDEIQIKLLAKSISESLSHFIGKEANLDEWAKYALNQMKSTKQRIRDILMWKYTFKYELENGRVVSLKFVKLPWF